MLGLPAVPCMLQRTSTSRTHAFYAMLQCTATSHTHVHIQLEQSHFGTPDELCLAPEPRCLTPLTA